MNTILFLFGSVLFWQVLDLCQKYYTNIVNRRTQSSVLSEVFEKIHIFVETERCRNGGLGIQMLTASYFQLRSSIRDTFHANNIEFQ